MKILIDIGHPAHVHLFKNFYFLMLNKGHEILITAKKRDSVEDLLNAIGIPFISLKKPYNSVIGKLYGILYFGNQLLKISGKFKPDIFLSHGSFYASHAAAISGKTNICLEDTGNMEQVRLYKPFTRTILTPESFHKNLGKKQVNYAGSHELAYLHPKQFNANSAILKSLGLEAQRYVFVRFVSWKASHDIGQKGIGEDYKTELVKMLNKQIRIVIASESEIPKALEKYKLQAPIDKIHDVLAGASLYIGEGATMAAESCLLGTPAIYVNTLKAGTITELENAGLLFQFNSFEGVVSRARDILLENKSFPGKWQKIKETFIADKIDVSAFLVWFIENFPKSVMTLKNYPDYQFNFR
ncbi:MAG: DUF354 domain-containing protein [Bacteroidales bacterium]|nr:DUF354 domain-containing protein [Bacteroidales bacterium]